MQFAIMKFINRKTIQLDKELNELDRAVINFVRVLSKSTKYIIVSGCVAILFGRSRATEDVDFIIERISGKKFEELFDALSSNGFWCINGENKSELFNTLNEGSSIRFAEKEQIIPNFEVKFCKNALEQGNLDKDKLKVILPGAALFISPIEQQIAFKEILLGADKDLEDARHLRKVFAEKIDKKRLAALELLFRGGD